MLSDHGKLTSVLWAYRRVLLDTKRAPFVAVKVPGIGSAMYQHCIKFVDSAEAFGVSVPALMKMCLDSFSPWWCQKTFKRCYPPISVVVGEKTRNKALKQFPKTLVNAKPDEIVDFYVEQLRGYGEAIAVGLINNGMCGEDVEIKRQVIQRLTEERVK